MSLLGHRSPGHSLEDVRVAVLKSGLARKDVRQCEEMRQIFKFQTLAPRGINRDFSFLWSLETRASIFSHAQTVSKRHTHENNYLVILRGSLNTLKKAVMPKRRLFYTALSVFEEYFHLYLYLKYLSSIWFDFKS